MTSYDFFMTSDFALAKSLLGFFCIFFAGQLGFNFEGRQG